MQRALTKMIQYVVQAKDSSDQPGLETVNQTLEDHINDGWHLVNNSISSNGPEYSSTGLMILYKPPSAATQAPFGRRESPEPEELLVDPKIADRVSRT